MSDKCKTCGGSGKISKYVKSILGKMEYPCPDCKPAEQGLSLETIIARIVEPLACNTGLPNFDACRDICKIAASQATEIRELKKLLEISLNCNTCSTLSDLKAEIKKLKEKIDEQVAEIERLKGYEAGACVTTKTIADLKEENDRLKKEIELLRDTEPNGVDDNGNPIQYRLRN